MPASIVQLSERAGVSKSTVSRVLNDDPRVSEQAVQAVRAAAAELGYTGPLRPGRPKGTRNGVRKRSVALLFPDPNPAALRTVLSARLILGIESTLREAGLSLIVTGLTASHRLPVCLEQGLVDGFIMRGAVLDRSRFGLIEQCPVPARIYLFEPRSPLGPGWDVVFEDNDEIAALASRWLVERNAKRILCVNRIPTHPSLRHRCQALVSQLASSSAKVHVLSTDQPLLEPLRYALGQLDGRPDGVFVTGPDDSVVETYRALRQLGIKVGGASSECPLISCNNDPDRLATLDPELPNLDIQPEALGRAAADMLLWRLKHPKDPARRLTLTPALVQPRPSDAESSPTTSKTIAPARAHLVQA